LGEQVIDLLGAHSPEPVFDQYPFRREQAGIYQQRVNRVICSDVPQLGIAGATARVVPECRMHHLVRQYKHQFCVLQAGAGGRVIKQ
jgi:hypothetical protein